MSQAYIELKKISKQFGDTPVICSFDLQIPQGKMITLLGPSGCGKSTILRLVAGLDTPTSGEILIAGRNVTQLPIQQRDIGLVFQSYALFPHLNVAENVGYGLKMQGVEKAKRQQLVSEALSLVELAGFEQRQIDQLSGGQQQRVALARSLVLKPKVLLFDEPLSNLDANLRRAMREMIRDLQQKLGITAIYVTHDQSEAFALSDEIVVMDKGRIVQQADAMTLYHSPVSRFVAHFMGECYFVPISYQSGQIYFKGQMLHLPSLSKVSFPDGEYWLGVRPEAAYLTKQGESHQHCDIISSHYMGSHWEIVVLWQGQRLLLKNDLAHFQPTMTEGYLQFSHRGVFLLPFSD